MDFGKIMRYFDKAVGFIWNIAKLSSINLLLQVKNKKMPKSTNENYRQNLKIPKSILFTAKVIQYLSPKQAEKFAAKLFQTPIKYATPKREEHMELKATKELLEVPGIHKSIQTFRYGNGQRKALLVHGWSGRGTQLVKIADALLEQGYTTFSFDGPAHGKSSGKTTNMVEFVKCILEMESKYGPFEVAVGHSLGSMALLSSVKEGLDVKKMTLIGSGDRIEDIIYDFTDKLGLNRSIGHNLKKSFDKKFQTDINSYSASISAESVHIPVLLIHDKKDFDSPMQASQKLNGILKESKLILTQGLGHRKILGDADVIKQILQFFKTNSN